MRLSLLIPVWSLFATASSSAAANRTVLPPVAFVRDFANYFNIVNIIYHVSSTIRDRETLADIQRSMPSKAVTFLNKSVSLPSVPAVQLHVFAGDVSTNKQDWQSLMKLFDARNTTDEDFWLVMSTNTSKTNAFDQIQLDLDDDVFAFELGANGSISMYEVYKISPNYTSSMILWYGQWSSAKGMPLIDRETKWIRRADLRGHHFNIATLLSQPYTTELEQDANGTYFFEGMFPDVFKVLQGLLNFTYTISLPEDNQYGTLMDDNVTWTGMVGMLQRGEIDIAPTDFSVTFSRSTVITFAQPITEVYSQLFIKNPTGGMNYMIFIECFRWQAWLAVFVVMVVVASPAMYVATKYNADDEDNPHEFSLSKSVVFSTGSIMARPWDIMPLVNSNRITFICIVMAGFLIFQYWLAQLTSYLSTRVIVLPFQSLEELVSGSAYNLMVMPGSSFVDSFRYSQDPVWQKAYDTRIEPFLDELPTSTGQEIQALMSDAKFAEFAVFDNYFAVSSYPAFINCSIVAIPPHYDVQPYAFGFQKNSPFLGVFNYYLKAMLEKGDMAQILNQYGSQPQVCPDYSGQAIGMDNCVFSFLVLGAAFALSLLIFLLELLTKRLMGSKAEAPFLLRWVYAYGIRDDEDHSSKVELLATIRSQRENIKRLNKKLEHYENYAAKRGRFF